MRGDDRYDPPLKCMVSNSVVMGKMKTITRPATGRPRKSRGIPSRRSPTRTRTLTPRRRGRAGPSRREPVAVPLRRPGRPAARSGLSHGRLGQAEDRLAAGPGLQRRPTQAARGPASIASKGYAVAGAEVNMDKYVCGIRLLFCRVKADGTLDTKDAYAGEWIGTPPEVVKRPRSSTTAAGFWASTSSGGDRRPVRPGGGGKRRSSRTPPVAAGGRDAGFPEFKGLGAAAAAERVGSNRRPCEGRKP